MFVSSELWFVSKMELVAKTAIILHNMAVEERRLGYAGDGVRGLSKYFDEEESDLQRMDLSTDCPEVRFGHVANVIENIKDYDAFARLRRCLIEHISSHINI